jgi:hypothetical protein
MHAVTLGCSPSVSLATLHIATAGLAVATRECLLVAAASYTFTSVPATTSLCCTIAGTQELAMKQQLENTVAANGPLHSPLYSTLECIGSDWVSCRDCRQDLTRCTSRCSVALGACFYTSSTSLDMCCRSAGLNSLKRAKTLEHIKNAR